MNSTRPAASAAAAVPEPIRTIDPVEARPPPEPPVVPAVPPDVVDAEDPESPDGLFSGSGAEVGGVEGSPEPPSPPPVVPPESEPPSPFRTRYAVLLAYFGSNGSFGFWSQVLRTVTAPLAPTMALSTRSSNGRSRPDPSRTVIEVLQT